MNYNPLKRKPFALLLAFICASFVVQAQDPLKPNSIYGKALFLDHFSPQNGALTSLGNFTNGFEVGYLRNLNESVNVGIPLKVGVIGLPGETDNKRYIGLDFIGQFQYYTPESRIIPYGLLGLGSVSEDFGDLDFQVPIGAGLHVRLGKSAVLNFQGEYRIAFAEGRDNLQYGIGLGFMIGPDEEILPPPIEVPMVDSDQDGIEDDKDQCPTIAGLAAFNGCPDTDSDGIQDALDECPNEYGPRAFNGCPDRDGDGIIDKSDKCPDQPGSRIDEGCPPKDTDGDGFIDAEDECPNVKGTLRGCPDADGDGIANARDECPNAPGEARFNGCPDTDGDGIPDLRDRCPNSPAPNSPTGCPEIKKEDKAVLDYALQAVQFETGKAILKEDSKVVLDQVIDVLSKYPDFRLEIIGHTDNVGSEINNLRLSQRRAKSCYDYLISQGVSPDILNSGGFGESNPIASNSTSEGRRRNRRVEFILAPR
jgi:outer membrane protein OmpA-like peptidoglycan-associated protein